MSADLSGLTPETTYHYRIVTSNASGSRNGEDRTYTPHGVVGLRTESATGVTESGADLNASLVGDGTATHYLFEWGRTSGYGEATAAPPGDDAGSPAGPTRTPLSSHLSGLEPFTTYHYRVVATGGSGTSYGEDRVFTTTPGAPVIGPESVSEVHADRAELHAQLDPNGTRTTYHFEFVGDEQFQEDGFDSADRAPSADAKAGMGNINIPVSVALDGLKPGTLYHYRAVAENAMGTGVPSVDRTFRTYRFGASDTCPNAHVRQQTGAALLFDCRAYELASAANAGGYDVESDLIPGQAPFGGRPLASGPSQLLYGVHNGGIPGTGHTTNHGVDPYVATRGNDGWKTRYVGIPADNPFATGPFGSPVLDTDSHADTFAFGGADLCSPCFSDGSTGEPVRLRDGSLIQGMVGSLDPGPAAEPSGHIGKDLSADGSHFVFGSTSKFEPDGNSNGDISIYDRDLNNGVTHVVSKTPSGETMTGAGIGELDISANGGRVLFGKLVSTDSAGNRHWHLYMNVGDSERSIDLMPGNTEGGLFDGMTSDGNVVYFTTADTPTGALGGDGDTSADIFRASISGGEATIARVSIGEAGTGETDSCTPAANTKHTYWNTLAGSPNCDVLAVGGGGGVAASGGAIYFFSPEKLDTSNPEREPVEGAPNLYVASPGSSPRFVATLESSANAPLPASAHPFKRSFGSYGNPVGTAIDHSTGDIYVLDVGVGFGGNGKVFKYDANGNPIVGFGTGGEIVAAGVLGFASLPTTIAVDNDPASPNYRDLFVPDANDSLVKVFSPSGAHEFDLEVLPGTSAVAVDPSTGNIFVTSFSFGAVVAFTPTGGLAGFFPVVSSPTGIAVDSSHRVYVSNGGGTSGANGIVKVYTAAGVELGELDAGPAKGVASRSGGRPRVHRQGRQGGRARLELESGRLSHRGRHARRIGRCVGLRRIIGDHQQRLHERRYVRAAGHPLGPACGQSSRHRQPRRGRLALHRRLPGQHFGRRRRLHLDPAADRLRER